MGHTDQPNAPASFAGDPDLARLAREGAALVLVAGNGTDVIWATPAGAAVIGATGQAEGFRLTTGLAPIERLATLATDLAPTVGARLERLRFVTGRQLTVVTVAARRGLLPDGSPAALLTIAGHRGAPGTLPAWFTQTREAPSAPQADAPLAQQNRAARQRFTFQLDADFTFTAISPSFQASLPDSLVVAGRTWDALTHAGVRDEAERVAAALARRETFHVLPTAWPGRDGVWLDVALSATPIHDPERGFAGFRGFGVSAPSNRPVEAPQRNTTPQTSAPPSDPPRAAPPSPSDDEGRLSQSEREAFRQIARALGASAEAEPAAAAAPTKPEPQLTETSDTGRTDTRSQDDTEQAEVETPKPRGASIPDDGIEDGEFIEIDTSNLIALPSLAYDEDEPAPRGDTLADNAARLFDRLPLGILVSRR